MALHPEIQRIERGMTMVQAKKDIFGHDSKMMRTFSPKNLKEDEKGGLLKSDTLMKEETKQTPK